MYEILFLLHFNTFIFDQALKINVFWRVVKSYQISNFKGSNLDFQLKVIVSLA